MVRRPEPFTAVIYCTADRDKADERTRSKWSRLFRYAAEFKDLDEPLRDFIKRKGGINKWWRGLLVGLGDTVEKLAAPPKPLATSWRDIFTRDIRGRRSDRTYPNELGRTSR